MVPSTLGRVGGVRQIAAPGRERRARSRPLRPLRPGHGLAVHAHSRRATVQPTSAEAARQAKGGRPTGTRWRHHREDSAPVHVIAEDGLETSCALNRVRHRINPATSSQRRSKVISGNLHPYCADLQQISRHALRRRSAGSDARSLSDLSDFGREIAENRSRNDQSRCATRISVASTCSKPRKFA